MPAGHGARTPHAPTFCLPPELVFHPTSTQRAPPLTQLTSPPNYDNLLCAIQLSNWHQHSPSAQQLTQLTSWSTLLMT